MRKTRRNLINGIAVKGNRNPREEEKAGELFDFE